MGVKFSNLKNLESTANAIGSNMFEGFEPTTELIQLYVDWSTGII
jgi:putative transcriptional regulator